MLANVFTCFFCTQVWQCCKTPQQWQKGWRQRRWRTIYSDNQIRGIEFEVIDLFAYKSQHDKCFPLYFSLCIFSKRRSFRTSENKLGTISECSNFK